MTDFRRRVYEIVRGIPEGSTMTYAQVASAIGQPNAARAVGNALNKNFSKEIPCHRVVRSDGELGGYNRGSSQKRRLLQMEGVNVF